MLLALEILGGAIIIFLSLYAGKVISRRLKPDSTDIDERVKALDAKSRKVHHDTVVLVKDDPFFGGFDLTDKTKGKKR